MLRALAKDVSQTMCSMRIKTALSAFTDDSAAGTVFDKNRNGAVRLCGRQRRRRTVFDENKNGDVSSRIRWASKPSRQAGFLKFRRGQAFVGQEKSTIWSIIHNNGIDHRKSFWRSCWIRYATCSAQSQVIRSRQVHQLNEMYNQDSACSRRTV